ncbi:MAG: hypothetical protein ACFFCX_16375 [Candidatus Sifarchaeia archaeon]
MVEPVTYSQIVLFFALVIVILASFGGLIAKLLDRFKGSILDTESAFESFICNLFIAFPVLFGLSFLLSFIPGLFSYLSILSVAAPLMFVVVNKSKIIGLLEILKKLPQKDLPKTVKRILSQSWGSIIPAFIFVAALVIRCFALEGLYVPLGGDARGWCFLAQTIVDNKGITFSNPDSASISAIEPHRYMMGLPTLVAFFSISFNMPVPNVLLMISAFIGACSALASYYFTKRITKNDLWAICSSLFMAIAAQAAFEYYSWGGNAELFSFFFTPILVWMIIGTKEGNTIRRLTTIIGIVAFSAFYHPYCAIYAISISSPVAIYRLLRRRPRNTWIMGITIFIIIILLIAIIGLFNLIPPLPPNNYIPESWGWRVPFFTWEWNPLQQNFDWSKLWPALYETFAVRYHSLPNTLLALLGIVQGFILIRKSKAPPRVILLPVIWFAVLFLLHENHPAGMYFIDVPFWNFIGPHRVKLAWIFSIGFLAGGGILALYNFGVYIRVKVVGIIGRVHPSSILAPKRTSMVFHILISFLIISVSVYPDTGRNIQWMIDDSLSVSPVSYADMDAFQWIECNVNGSARFFVDEYDAGIFLQYYTNRTVFPGLYNFWTDDPENLKSLHDTYINDPNDPTTLELLKEFSITHIYIGAERYYHWDPRFNPVYFINSKYYNLVYMRNGVFIFEVL